MIPNLDARRLLAIVSDQSNPWKTLDTKIVYQNPWMSLREDRVKCPDGSEGIYGFVVKCAAVGVVALDHENNVCLVGQYRYPLERYSWEIVEGGAETDELPIDTAKRELQEEAGLECTEWEQLGSSFHLSNCISSEEAFLFIARGLRSVDSSPDPTEVLAIQMVPLEECLQMIDSGEITDAMTIIALQRLSNLLKEEERLVKEDLLDKEGL